MSAGNRVARLLWAQEHLNWSDEQWSTVLFSDESRFGLHPDSRRTRVWRCPGPVSRLETAQEVHSYRGGTVMVWGGISVGGRSDLISLQGFLNSIAYRDIILQPLVIPYAAAVGPRFIFMHDNATPHSARIISDFLDEENIDVLPWPAQSPDLNPIEHLWDMLQRRVMRRNLFFNNRQELILSLQREWAAIDQEEIDALILSMSRRCKAVVNSRGGHTTY